MNTYVILKKVTPNDLDDLNHVNNVVYIQWIQEISKKHWQEVVKDNALNYIWVVRRHDVTYYKASKLEDEIEISTRIIDTKGPISYRQVEMKNNKTKKLIVNAITEWCLLHSQTHKPIRVPENIKSLFFTS